jgi:hypothetical protein
MSERSERSEAAGAAGADQLGNAAEEAAKLFDAMGEWLAHRATAGGTGSSSGGSSWAAWGVDHLATGSASCQLCPLCRVIAAARASGPEVVAHLDDALRSLTAAVRLAAQAMGSPGSAERPAAGFETIVIN